MIMKTNIKNWQEFKITDIFEIENGKCSNATSLLENGNEIMYIGAKKKDNGSRYYVSKNEKYITKGNCIVFICDGDGSVGFHTYQEDDFIGSTTLKIGRNNKLNEYNALFIITMLDCLRYKFSYGRKYKLENENVSLPCKTENNVFIPDWEYMENYVKSLEIEIIKKMSKFKKYVSNYNFTKINIESWKEFKITDIFEKIESTKGNKTYELEDGNDLIYIAAKKTNNGAQQYTSYNENIISKGNCIVFVNIGDGAAGYSTYQSDDFIGMKGKTTCGYSSKLNKYNALFLVTILDKHRYKYCYGRSWTSFRLNNTKIQLPAKLNNKNKYEPDWEYMENYIKSLPYGDLI